METKRKNNLGFTLIEIIVSVGIFALFTVMAVADLPAFNKRLELKQTAQEIALAVRQAQVYGTSVKRLGNDAPSAYGVYFTTGGPSSFVLFADNGNKDNVWDSGDTKVEEFFISSGDVIYDLCGEGICGIGTLSVVFKRPGPSIYLKKDQPTSSYSYVNIKVQSPDSDTKIITVRQTGQISVQ